MDVVLKPGSQLVARFGDLAPGDPFRIHGGEDILIKVNNYGGNGNAVELIRGLMDVVELDATVIRIKPDGVIVFRDVT
jgi:hypothetical protein